MLPASLSSALSSPRHRSIAGAMLGVLLAAAFALGIFARFDDLGSRQLTADEYYMVRSTEWVAETGVPAFPSGGYYTRGLLQQYVTAGLVHGLGSSPWVHRLLPTLFGLLAIGAAGAYARRHVGCELALAVAAAVAVSSWQVEFSRFIRMYAGLQLFTLLFLVALHRAWWEGRGGRYVPHAALLLAALCHQLAISLLPLLFAPLLLEDVRRRLGPWRELGKYLGASAGAGLVLVGDRLVKLRNFGVADPLPPELAGTPDSVLRLPPDPFLGETLFSLHPALVLTGAGVAWAAVFLLLRVRCAPLGWAHLYAGLFALAAAFHQLVPAGLFLALLVLRYDLLPLRAQPRGVVGPVALGVLCAVAWLVLAGVDRSWLVALAPDSPARAFRLAFLAFPDYYLPVVVPWRQDLPWIGALGALALAHQLLRLRKAPRSALLASPALLLVYVATFVAVFDTKLVQTRYTFFVYPVLLTVIALSVRDAAQALLPNARQAGLVAAGAFAALFALGDDFHPRHLLAVGSPEASYRLEPFARYEALWYHRHDFASPGEFLNEAVGDGAERVVVVGRDPIEYVLRREFAFFRPSVAGILEKSRAGGTRDLWSGARMLTTREQLRDYTQDAATVWVVDAADPQHVVLDPAAIWGERLRAVERAHRSRDRRIAVWRVSLEAAPEPGREADGADLRAEP